MAYMKTIFNATTGETITIELTQEEIDALLASKAIFETQQLNIHTGQKIDLQTILLEIDNITTLAGVRIALKKIVKQIYRLKFGMTDQQVEDLSMEP